MLCAATADAVSVEEALVNKYDCYDPTGANCTCMESMVLTTDDTLDPSGGGTGPITGTVPAELSSCIGLEVLYFYDTSITGTIPPQLSELTNLDNLQLCLSSLSGTIPSSLSTLTNLEQLCLGTNSLSGTLPSELSTLTNLENLIVAENQLSGTIPSSFSTLTNLKHLIAYTNYLTGQLPSELRTLARLELLYFNDNNLTGRIPSEWSMLMALTNLCVRPRLPVSPGGAAREGRGHWQHSMTCSPSLLSTCRILRENRFTGSIPAHLSVLNDLSVMYVVCTHADSTPRQCSTAPARFPRRLERGLDSTTTTLLAQESAK